MRRCVSLVSAIGCALTFATSFVGRNEDEIDIGLPVDREVQCRAISCHGNQAADYLSLWRRLELQGDHEWLRWLPP